MLGTDARFHKLVADVDAVTNAAGKRDRAPTLGVLVPVGNDVPDQLGAIHTVGKLILGIVAIADRDAFEIGIDRCIDPRLDEVSLLDQRRDLRRFGQDSEDAAEAAPIAAAWRGGTADHRGVRICLDKPLIGPCWGVVCLVDHNQISGWQRYGARADGTDPERGNGGNLHRLLRA